MYEFSNGYWRCKRCPMKFSNVRYAYFHSFAHKKWRSWG